jgi:hypothetical protein
MIKQQQLSISDGGLIILQALYGDIIDITEQIRTDYRPGNCIEITMQLQAKVDPLSSSLLLNKDIPIYEQVDGVVNPNVGNKNRLIKNRLYLSYLFNNRFHWCYYEQNETIILPLHDHCEDEVIPIHNIQDLLEMQRFNQISQHFLPTFDLDTNEPLDTNGQPYPLLGSDWENEFEYNFYQSVYLDFIDKRPLNSYFEPKLIAYYRQKYYESIQAKKKVVTLLAGVSCSTLVALQLFGIINMKKWPVINLFFPDNTTTTTTTTPSIPTTNSLQHQRNNDI